MFGPFAERTLGTRRYLGLFIGAALAASISEVGFSLLLGSSTVLVGASGALTGILGYLTTTEPDMRVYFFGIIPMPLWFTALLLVWGSIGIVVFYGLGAFGVAHLAHAGGCVAGILYGLTKDTSRLRLYFESVTS